MPRVFREAAQVPRIIELAAECVCALYERASAPDVSASETDRSSRRSSAGGSETSDGCGDRWCADVNREYA